MLRLVFGIFWTGCAVLICLGMLEWKLRAPPKMRTPVAVSDKSLRVLTVGDSITLGEFGGSSYPRELQRLFDKMPISLPVQVINEGVSGLSTRDVRLELDEYIRKYHPDIFITMIGEGDPDERPPGLLKSLRVYHFFFYLKRKWRERNWRHFGSEPLGYFYYRNALISGEDSFDYIRRFGAVLRREKRYQDAISYHQNVLIKYPHHNAARLELGQVYEELGKFNQAEKYYKEVLHDKDQYLWSAILLAMLYEKQGKLTESIQLTERTIRSEKNQESYLEYLAHLYEVSGKLKDAAQLLESTIIKFPNFPRLHEMLATVYKKQRKPKLAKQEAFIANRMRSLKPFPSVAKDSYPAISNYLQRNGVLHIAVQYPMRPVSLLKEMLGPESDLLLYVDNEQTFRNALTTDKYKDLFIDNYGGNFGHMTEKANKIVAENILEVLKPWLKRHGLLSATERAGAFSHKPQEVSPQAHVRGD